MRVEEYKIQAVNIRRTRNDNISVACADCPECDKENVIARVASAERVQLIRRAGDHLQEVRQRLQGVGIRSHDS